MTHTVATHTHDDPPSLVARMHAAHLERLQRINSAARYEAPVATLIPSTPTKIQPVPYNYYWSQMWFYDLVSHRPYDTTALKISAIVDAVSRHFNVSKTDIMSQRRTRPIVRPRQVAMYLAKKLTLRSLPEIGRRLGGRDHTTILSGIRKIEQLRKVDPDMDAAVRAIASKLGGRL